MENRPIAKVLLISTHSDESGAPRHVETLVRTLRNSVNFVGYISGDQGPVFGRIENYGINCFLSSKLRSKISPLSDLFSFFHILYICWSLRPDIIHVHSSKAGLLGRAASFILRKRCIYTVHGWGWRGMSPMKQTIVKLFEKVVYVLTSCKFLAVSDSVRLDGISELQIDPDKITTILNGIEDVEEALRHSGKLSKRVNLIMPARVCAAKDHDTLLRSFALLSENYHLALCGHGTDSDEFIDRVKSLVGSSFDRVKCLGQRSDIDDLISQADILVLSSHFEALPLSLIEGMRAGLPTIGSDVGGIREIITPDVGIVVNSRDVRGLNVAITKLACPIDFKSYSDCARARFLAKFSAARMGECVLNEYNTILDR